ncbi:hypothetical protein GCM10025777_57340 [Membranihabitans marinus]
MPAQDYTPIRTLCAKYLEKDGNQYLFWVNKPMNYIELYDLNQKKHIKTIQIPREGPNGIIDLAGGCSVFGLDSIFVSSSEIGKIYLMDTSGLYYKVIHHTDTSYRTMNNQVNLNSNIHSEVFHYGPQKLIIPHRAPKWPKKPSEEMVSEALLFKTFDLASNENKKLPLNIPFEIYDNDKLRVSNSNVRIQNRLYFQFANNHKVFYTDDLKNIHFKEIISDYSTDFVPSDKFQNIWEYYKREFMYYSLISDPYQKVLYRLIKLPVNDLETADGENEMKMLYDRASIMVLDYDLNVLGEFLFNQTMHAWSQCFVNEKRLHILRSPLHTHYDENTLKYDVFQLNSKSNE